jgi:hypothetical protein
MNFSTLVFEKSQIRHENYPFRGLKFRDKLLTKTAIDVLRVGHSAT